MKVRDRASAAGGGLGALLLPLVVACSGPTGSKGPPGEDSTGRATSTGQGTGVVSATTGTTGLGGASGGSGATVGSTSGATGLDSTGPSATTSDGTTTGPFVDCEPILVEVLYDVTGSDNGNEWVKLYNPCEVDLNLSFFSLGWGGEGYTFGTGDLSGVIEAGGCLVVGGPNSNPANGNPTIGLSLNFEPNLENGGSEADGVALFRLDADEIDATSIPSDAVIYGSTNDNGLLDIDGLPGQPHVGDVSDDQSIRRVSMAQEWIEELTPMPDLCPPF